MKNYIKFLFKKYILRKKPLVNPRTGKMDLKYNMKNINKDFYLYQRNSDKVTTLPKLKNDK